MRVVVIPAKNIDRETLATAEKVRSLGRVVIACSAPSPREVGGFTVLNCPKGKWASILKAVERIDGDSYLVIDSDMPVSVKDAWRLVEGLRSSDLAIVKRHPDERPLVDRILSIGFRLLARMLGVRFHDPQAGAKAFKRRLILEASSLIPRGYLGDLALIAYAISRGFRVVELPVRWKDNRTWGRRLSLLASLAVEFLIEAPRLIAVKKLR